MELRRLFEGMAPAAPVIATPVILPLRSMPWIAGKRIEPVLLDALAESEEQRRAWSDCEEILSRYLAGAGIHS